MRLCKCPVKSSNFYPRLLAFLQHLWYPDIHAFGIVVLVPFLARNTWGTCQDLCFLAQAHTGIPFKGKCCGWTSPCPSYHDCTMHFSENQQETLRNEIYHLQAWRVYGTPKDHTARSQIKIERRPRNLPLLGCKGWGGYGVLRVYSVWLISSMRARTRAQEEQWSGIKVTQSFLKEGASWVGGSLVLYLVVLLVAVSHACNMFAGTGCLWHGCLSIQRLHVRHPH